MSSSPADPFLPAWALAQAEAALKIGQTLPEIERGLVAKGLEAETATAVVMAVLEGRVRKQNESAAKTERRNRIHRMQSALVGGACILLAFWSLSAYRASRTGIAMVGLVACIWFPNWWGGYESRDSFTPKPQNIFIRWLAWLVLALVFIQFAWFGIASRA